MKSDGGIGSGGGDGTGAQSTASRTAGVQPGQRQDGDTCAGEYFRSHESNCVFMTLAKRGSTPYFSCRLAIQSVGGAEGRPSRCESALAAARVAPPGGHAMMNQMIYPEPA